MKTKVENRSVYWPVALFIGGMLAILLIASNVAENSAAAAKVPDVVKTYQSCEYFGESSVMVKYYIFDYISTSCGEFNKPITKFELEKGKTYDIEITHPASIRSYISKITPSSR